MASRLLRRRTVVPPEGRRIRLDYSRSSSEVTQLGELQNKDNAIRTAYYSVVSFVPLNLWKQYQRHANVFFTVIMVLQTWMEVSITQGEPSMAMPLAFVLIITALKDAMEDLSRHRFDRIENNRSVQVLERHDEAGKPVFADKTWSQLKVGSLVKLANRQMIPADIALLQCSDKLTNMVFVMTAGLDGETNLKQRVVASEVPTDLRQLDGSAWLTCGGPNKLMESWDGTLSFKDADGASVKIPLGPSNLLLRGSQMRNTDWALGVVVFAGPETKLQMNAARSSFKTSSSMALAQRLMLSIFLMQCVFCLGAALTSSVLMGRSADYYYLDGEQRHFAVELGLRFVNYIIIFTNFIPISLLVTIDMVKFCQGFFISWDLGMYHAESDRAAKVNCSELNEELGCVEHVFTDKTGTLTANVMKFKACGCAGKMFRVNSEDVVRLQSGGGSGSGGGGGGGNDGDPATGVADRAALQQLFKSLALNHAVIPEVNKTDGSIVFSASSPDEGALVQASQDNGFRLVGRGIKSLAISEAPQGEEGGEGKGEGGEGGAGSSGGGEGSQVEYDILNLLEFSSDRKRSSIIVRDPRTGAVELHCKGADNVIFDRLSEKSRHSDLTKVTFESLNVLATEGLRTLCVAKRVIDEKVYDEWARRFHEATVSVENRKQRIAILQEEIEAELELIGCTGIEDKLQEDVAETISSLRSAGIKVWMLTGDKVDTAINIGFSCALWTHKMELLYLLFDKQGYDDITAATLDRALAGLQSQVDALPAAQLFCMVLDTKSVFALNKFQRMPQFLTLANRCESVICARVSPDQKAIIVQGVRDSDSSIKTLSIGDGANDVPMIQKAHVGIGIYGQEGLQAANAADFAIARFKFLKRLLFVHGRWSARRVGILVCYMFYKNAILVLPQFFFAFVCLASGQNLYLDYPFYQGYNIIYTSFPILFFGIYDKDVDVEHSMQNPKIYGEGSLRSDKARFLSPHIFWRWILEGFVQSVFITFLLIGALDWTSGGIASADGSSHGIWRLGTLVHLCVCVVVTLRLFLENYTITRWMLVSYVASVLVWFGTCYLWSETSTVPGLLSSSQAAVGVWSAFRNPASWAASILTIVVAILPSFAFAAHRSLFSPSEADMIRARQPRRRPKPNSVHPAVPSSAAPAPSCT